MKNQFYDQITEVTFLIPGDVALEDEEKVLLVERWKDQQKTDLFVHFKSLPGNKNWQGDEAAKKEELLFSKLQPGTSVLIEDVLSAESTLENHPPLTTEA